MGKQDEVPLSYMGMWDLRFLGHAFGLVSNDYGVYLDDQGQVQTTLNTDENRAFLTWLHELWEEELLDHDGFTTMDTLRQITDSDAVMTYGVFFGPTPLNLVPASALDEYVLLPPLEYQGQQIYRDLLGDVVPGSFALTSACQDPETMLRWVDYLYSVEGSRLAQSGLEGVEYTLTRTAPGTGSLTLKPLPAPFWPTLPSPMEPIPPDITRWNCSSPMTAATPSAWFPPCRS